MATRAKKRQRVHRQKPLWELEEEDHLLHMDPSLMTERQQLAFLLRTTAHEASDASDESSEDEAVAVASPRRAKKPRRIQDSSATTPRRGPGRPPKHKKNPRAGAPKLRVQTEEHKHDEHEAKPSPSGSDEVTQLDAVRSFAQRTPRCALCCDYDTASFSDALFLCPACDQKYPTQQALGRRACMT